jgi:hypothetical protein
MIQVKRLDLDDPARFIQVLVVLQIIPMFWVEDCSR